MSVRAVALGKVTTTVMGQAPPGAQCNKIGEGTAFVKAGEFSDLEPIVREWTTNPLKFAKRGDVLVCVVGATAGKINLGIDCAIGRSVAAVRPDADRLDTRYLYYFLRTRTDLLRAGSQGLAQGVITREMISKIEILLPSLKEQRRIAAMLEKADALRRERKRVLGLLDDLSGSIFLQTFGEMNMNVAVHPTAPFGELVESQKIGLVRSASELQNDAPTPYLRMNAITLDGRLDLAGVKRTNVSAAELLAYELKAGDFLFNTRNSRELVGKTAVFQGPNGYVYNNNILRVRFGSRVLPEYAVAFFQTPFARRELEARKSGTTSVFAIYQKSLDSLPVAVPPIEMQATFVEKVSNIKQTTVRCEEQRIILDKLFSSLQHRAFAGQL